MGLRFTEKAITGLACPPGRKDMIVFDDTLAGFGCRVTDGGTKTFLAQYNLGRIKRRMPLGKFGELTVKQARDRALSVLGEAKAGRDPFGETKASTAKLAADVAAAKVKTAEDAFTLDNLIDAWERDRTKAGKRAGYLIPATASLRRHFRDCLARPATSITESEAARRVEKIEADAGPMAANRALAYARAAYGRGVMKKLVAANPFEKIEPVAAETSRDRTLNDEEVGAIWRAAATLPTPYGAFVRVLLLTGQRRNEVAGMRWGELSADLSSWLLPSARAKNNEAHVVALAAPAQEIIEAQPRIKDCPYVFPGERHTPVCAFSFAKRLLDKAITEERAKAGLDPVALPDWIFHDFRRSTVTWMARAGIPSDVADRILNHREGKAQGVKAIYQRHQFLDERRAALGAWAKHVLACAEGHELTGNIVALRAAG